MNRQKLLCIVGPTASGKTSLSIELAKRFDGEIVSADSMQIYRQADIGTAKPTADERQGIPHHMIDVCDISEEYSAARFVREADECISDIRQRGKLPIIVGGTGFYVDSLVRGDGFAAAPISNEKIRKELEELSQTADGMEQLVNMLKEADPQSAQRLHINDKKRIIRALEVYKISGKTISEHNAQSAGREPKYDACYIGIAPDDRELLKTRIDMRVDQMEKDGLEQEARSLLLNQNLAKTAAQAIGYKEFADYFAGKCSKEQALGLIKLRTRQYSKRQMTWFKKNKNIFWIYFAQNDKISEIADIATEYVKRCGVL